MNRHYDWRKTAKKTGVIILLGVVALGLEQIIPIIELQAAETLTATFVLAVLKAVQDVAKHKYELIGRNGDFKW